MFLVANPAVIVSPPAAISSAVIVGWLVFGVVTGIAAQMAKQRRGVTPWRLHPVLWGLIGVVLGILGLVLCVIAIFTTKPALPTSGYPPPSGYPGGWPPPDQVSPPPSAPTAPPTSQPADWYPDPYQRHELRYWDGQSWTSNVSDGGTVSADPPVPS